MDDLYANGLERVLWYRILVRVLLLEVCCILLLGWRVERHLDFDLTGEVDFRCGVTGWAEPPDCLSPRLATFYITVNSGTTVG